jgi:mRNA interferase MazF
MIVNQYDIVLVNLDPTQGHEIQKTRPCVVLSPDEMNRHLHTIVVAPMTSTLKNYPTRVAVKHNGQLGMVALDQVRTIDRSRIIKNMGHLAKDEVSQCKQVIRETYVD